MGQFYFHGRLTGHKFVHKKFKFSPLMVTGIDVDISFSFILTCITFLHCTGQEVSNSTPLSGQGGSAMFSPKTSAQSTPSSS